MLRYNVDAVNKVVFFNNWWRKNDGKDYNFNANGFGSPKPNQNTDLGPDWPPDNGFSVLWLGFLVLVRLCQI